MQDIETTIFKSLLYNEQYARAVYPHLRSEFFEGFHKPLFEAYSDLFDKYGKVPTVDALGIHLSQTNINESDFEQIVNVVEEAYQSRDDLPDTQWMIDTTEGYCQDRAMYNSLYKAIAIIDGSEKNLDRHAIRDLWSDALSISFNQTTGKDYFDDAEERYNEYVADDARIKLALEALNELSNGGLKKATLSAILAGTNVGKSALMIFLAAELVRQGYNVLYVTLEMSENSVYERVDANLMGVPTDKLKTLTRDQFMSKVGAIKDKTKGRFKCKQFPTSSAHAGHFRHLFKELDQKQGFKPDVVFIDYINICASSRYRAGSVNSYTYIKAIAEELRGLAVEFDVPMMTATQVNREGMNNTTPDMTTTSESFGLPATLDWFIAITADEVMREHGQQQIHLLKTRWGNKAKARSQMVGIDWDLMRYSDVGSTRETQNKVGHNKPAPSNKDEDDQSIVASSTSKRRPKKSASVSDIDWS